MKFLTVRSSQQNSLNIGFGFLGVVSKYPENDKDFGVQLQKERRKILIPGFLFHSQDFFISHLEL